MDSTPLQVEDPEQILRRTHRSMAAPPENAGDPWQQDPCNDPEEVNIPDLFVPDLDNMCLEDAIANSMAMNDRKTVYRIHCPRLKDHIGVDTLNVKLPGGELEVPTDPPVDFIANCPATSFDQPRLLIEAMESLPEKHTELAILPGDDLPIVSNRYLSCWELNERLGHYFDLCIRYGECVLKYEGAILLVSTAEQAREELHQDILMHKISSIMDKIVSALLKDISYRKVKKKTTYPTPKINPRATSFTSMQQLCDLKSAPEDEVNGIMQVAFLPESEEEARRTIVMLDGEDILDDTGRPRDDRRRPNLTTTANTCTTDRPTVNFGDRDQHRTIAITEVQQTLMNDSTNNDRANNTNICPDCPNNTNPCPRNNEHNQDNQSSTSSDTKSIGHWDNNWADQKCSTCGHHGHNSWNCGERQRGELYCNRCTKDTHCDTTCSLQHQHGSSTPRFPHQYNNHPSPCANDYTVPPVEPNYINRPSPTPSNAVNIADVTQMFITHLNENRQQTNLFKHRKDLLISIANYNGKDRKCCLMWINQLKHTAIQAKMPLKELLAAKAGPIVMSAVLTFARSQSPVLLSTTHSLV